MKINGVVVLYNPTMTLLENIKSYIDDLAILYVMDNSEFPNPELISRLLQYSPKINYIDMVGNKGISHPLNIAAQKSIEAGAEWLLTMDQDSKCTAGMIDHMFECTKAAAADKIGLVGPYHWIDPDSFFPGVEPCEDVLTMMTSGNIIDLKAFKEVGGFREDYFIGYVDHEYCLRLRDNGFRIVQCNRAVLSHALGNATKHRFIFKNTSTTNHPAIRLYYRTRNRLKTLEMYKSKFPGFAKNVRIAMIKEIIKILLFEMDKFNKMLFIMRGYRDYKKNVFGSYQGSK